MKRPARENIHMATALMWSFRSLDPRLRVGAVVTSWDLRRVLSIGYNGPARQLPHSYARNEPGNSGCLHAEDNAIATCDSTIGGKVMFVTHSPCEMCAMRIANSGFSKVWYLFPYRDETGLNLLRKCDVGVGQLEIHNVSEILMTATQQNDAQVG
jgi:dCMP deaminase